MFRAARDMRSSLGTDHVDTPSLGYVVLAEISLEPGQAGTVEGLGGGEALSYTHRGGGGVD